jgi:hypothetical protein
MSFGGWLVEDRDKKGEKQKLKLLLSVVEGKKA